MEDLGKEPVVAGKEDLGKGLGNGLGREPVLAYLWDSGKVAVGKEAVDKEVVVDKELGKGDLDMEPVLGDFLNLEVEGLDKAPVAWDLGKEEDTELALVDI
eukprot:TRINITY_DN194_c2_g2_i1.p2 TRINITY_DN194_c2_g2~~TRINITY_DN194_c2_g2_i1.p2  ORF type:complete len:101 (+),score=41.95 TRINITY_DN194_c2_g2_i1:52-354(+)